MQLPTEKNKIQEENPKFMILFGKPKSGKTTIVSGLEDCLIIDLEEGTNYIESLSIKINNTEEIVKLFSLLNEKKKESNGEYVYKYGVIDTATKLEELILPIALRDYKTTPMGKSFKGDDVRTLPNGAGYLYIRNAFKKVVNSFKPFFKYFILLGHTKDKSINKGGKELSEQSIDLSGKLERIISAEADALGYVYRLKNKTVVNFNGGGDFIVEARPVHLRGKEFIVAESDEQGNMSFNWDQIYV